MNSFKIGDTEFGIGDVDFSIQDNLLNLEIVGDAELFEELTEHDDSEWGWALDAPRIYFWDVPYEGKSIVVDEDALNQYDIALYMMEHNDFMGTVEITKERIHILGNVDMMGEVLTVDINVERD